MTAVHLPFNHSHRDSRQAKNAKFLKKEREKEVFFLLLFFLFCFFFPHTHTRTEYRVKVGDRVVYTKKKEKKKKKHCFKHLKHSATARIVFPSPRLFGRFFGLVSWTKFRFKIYICFSFFPRFTINGFFFYFYFFVRANILLYTPL